MAISMSSSELERYLSTHLVVTLVTLNLDGTPLPTPLWYVNHGTVLYMRTMTSTAKAKNLLRDRRIAAQVESGDQYLELSGAIFRGQAEVVEDPEELTWFERAFAEKYAPFRGRDLPPATQRHYATPRTVIKLRAEKIRTWDNSKLRVRADTNTQRRSDSD